MHAARGRLGFYARGTHSLVEPEACPIARPALSALIPALRRAVRESRVPYCEVEAVESADGRVVLSVCCRPVEARYLADLLGRVPGVAGVDAGGGRGRQVRGDVRVRWPTLGPGGAQAFVEQDARGFAQANAGLNPRLVETVLSLAAPQPGERVLELYAGAGNLTVPLAASGAEVTAVEVSRAALSDAATATAGRARTIAGDVGTVAARLAEQGERFDVVVADPPRTGFGPGIAAAIGATATAPGSRVVVCSCDPATMARDCAAIASAGAPPDAPRRVERLVMVDMFPQTRHVEAVARLASRAALLPSLASLAALSALAAIVAAPATATAGNTYTFLIGGRAAGMGGAYVAMSEEPSSAWHNPAGLGFNERSSFDVKANAIFLQSVRAGDLFVTELPSGPLGSDFDTTSIQMVPTSMTMAYKVGAQPAAGSEEPGAPPRLSHTVAFSIFVPQATRFARSVSKDRRDTTGGGIPFDYHQRISLDLDRKRFFIGPSWGMSIGREWAVGASLFFTYGQSLASAAFNLDVKAGDGSFHDFLVFDGAESVLELGLAAAAGVQWRPAAGLRLGLAVRAPGVWIYRGVSGPNVLATAIGPERAFSDEERGGSPWGVGMSTPFTTTLGMAYARPGSFAVAIEGDWAAPYEDPDVDVRRGHLFNARVGAEVHLTPKWILSLGAYTDLSADPEPKDLADVRAHFFGGTAAVTLLAPYLVTGSGPTDRITFSNTLGVKYAYGFGKIGAFEFAPFSPEGVDPLTPATRDASFHELSVLIGSTVQF